MLDKATRSLVVRTDPATHTIISDLIEELDKRPASISLDVIVFEVQLSDSLDLGFDALILTQPKGSSDLAVTLNPSGGGLRSVPGADTAFFGRYTHAPLVIPVVGADGVAVDVVVPRESGVILADAREIETRVLLSPHLLVISGEEQVLSIGNNIPILVAATSPEGQVGPNLQTRVNIERHDVGVVLRATATVGQAGDVHLELELDISRVVGSLAGPVAAVGPTLATRQITATMNLRDGELAVIGVHGEPFSETIVTGVPFLMNIPFLGYFFRTASERNMKSDLVIAAQARILRSPEENLAETIRRRIAFERALAGAGPLREKGAPYAVLVETRRRKEDAEAIAESFGPAGQVVRWEQDSQTYFDVYVTGFETLPGASAEALRIREGGWNPKVIVVPVSPP